MSVEMELLRSISASTSATSFRATGDSVTLGCRAHTAPPSAAAMVMTAAAILVFIRRHLV